MTLQRFRGSSSGGVTLCFAAQLNLRIRLRENPVMPQIMRLVARARRTMRPVHMNDFTVVLQKSLVAFTTRFVFLTGVDSPFQLLSTSSSTSTP